MDTRTAKLDMVSTTKKVSPIEFKVKKESSPFLPFQNLDRAAEVAYYYGFMPIKTPVIQKEDSTQAKQASESEHHEKNYGSSSDMPLYINMEEKVTLLRMCEENKLLNSSQPAMLYFEGIPRHADLKNSAHGHVVSINLNIIGTTKSIAEAELIKTAIEILRDEGFEDLYVDINSLGDKDSIANFSREITQYYRKHANDLENHCRTELKKDLFAPMECENQKCLELAAQAPKSVAFLSEPSRVHFTEVLEYLESMNIPYKIDNHILGNRRLCCHTIFLIKTLNVEGVKDTPEETLALGFRYNGLAKKMDIKKDAPAVGVSITFKRKGRVQKKCHALKKSKVYFIQFGFDAKLKSLQVIEILRHAKIPLHQALAKDKLTSQISSAENLGIPFVLIMGQKEAIEDSVIVRDMSTRFQETVKIGDLAEYLKKIGR